MNRLLDNTLSRSQEILGTLRSAVATLPQLIDQLETGHAQANEAGTILTRAHALAASQTVETLRAPPEEEAESAAAPTAQPTAVSAHEHAPVPPAFRQAEVPQPQPVDDVLADIYARETAAHVAVVRAYLDREGGTTEPHALPEEIYRACHTLAGSSNMAEARHGIRLAQPLDQWLRKAFDSGLGLEDADLMLLSDCMAAMESVATNLNESTGFFLTHEQLRTRISYAQSALERRTAAAAHAAQQARTMAEASPAFDPEIAAIFTEEATELLEAAEVAVTAWRAEPDNAELRSALKRPLHTLKGGARMAGIQQMGDLSHELETLVMQIDQGLLAPTAAALAVVQASVDELARMREAVASGRGLAPATEAIARIQALSQPDAEPAAPAAPAPEPVTAQHPAHIEEQVPENFPETLLEAAEAGPTEHASAAHDFSTNEPSAEPEAGAERHAADEAAYPAEVSEFTQTHVGLVASPAAEIEAYRCDAGGRASCAAADRKLGASGGRATS